jgi:N-carbamoyl-L-amino-acid hydrolase
VTAPLVDGTRLVARLAELGAIGRTPSGATTREAYGIEDVAARTVVAGWMREAGLTVTVDAAANLIGRHGADAGRSRWLVTGSHLDTVVEAGTLDGAYGVVAAVEVADALARSGRRLRHDLVVVAFANEEGARGTDGMVGSRALMGEVGPAELATPDDDGVTLADRLATAGGDPAAVPAAAWDPSSVAAFVELHVEQGPVLDSSGTVLGVVTGITGRQGVDIEIRGAANHAGTTPMDLRADAVTAAAEVVLAIEALARAGAVRVATCGHLQVTPNVRNVVPGRVQVSAEVRDQDPAVLAAIRPVIEATVREVAARRGMSAQVEWGQYVAPIATDPAVLRVIRATAAASGLASLDVPSGAGHDAQILGAHVPMGMIFVPSVAGVSHSGDEHTAPEHLVAGAQLLADALVALDGTEVGS